jgi:hypothetical protein
MKTKAALYAIMACLSISTALARSKTCYIFASPGQQISAISIEKAADYVSMPLQIQSSQRDPQKRSNEIKNIQNLIIAQAKTQNGIIIHKGPISLSAVPNSRMKSSSYSQVSTAQFHILAKLDDNTNVYDCANRIRTFLDSIKKLDKDQYFLGHMQLTVENPEQYRYDIIKQISKDIETIKSIMPSKVGLSLSGLENPVSVLQRDDRNVMLFIDYSLTIKDSEDK